jgi:Tetracyclin repressor-like, C-terminal domain
MERYEAKRAVIIGGTSGIGLESSLMGVSHLGVDENDRKVRSGLIASQMMGLAMMRYVWRIEPVASMKDTNCSRRSPPTCSTTSTATYPPRQQTNRHSFAQLPTIGIASLHPVVQPQVV